MRFRSVGPQRWRHVVALILALGGCVPAAAANAQPASYTLDAFVVAHADDWQLFMGDVLVEALRRQHPVLVIVASAGDAARGAEFWQTREQGALASMQAALALAGAPSPVAACVASPVPLAMLNGRRRPAMRPAHTVRTCRTGDATTVFLRLPDGRPDGAGYPVHGYQSLLRLATTGRGPLAALDGSASYATHEDLAETVAGIIRLQHRLSVAVHVHTHDPDPMTNVIDHADHRETGRVALDAARLLHAAATLYAGYSNVRREDNLTPEAAAWKAYCFVQYDRAMMARHGSWSAYAENAWAHALYLSRTYARPNVEHGLLRRAWPGR
jgi:LmbE family N-acetylglucosaminyl deacetylase